MQQLQPADLLYLSLQRQSLLQKTSKKKVLTNLCGLQAQFANNPKYGLRIRSNDFQEDDWNNGLVKIWSFRSTMHLVLQEEVGLYLSAKGIPDDWRDSWYGSARELKLSTTNGFLKESKPYWSQFIYEQIAGGVCERSQLKEACRRQGMEPELQQQVFHGWGGLLKEMASRGLIVYEGGTAKRFLRCEAPLFLEKDEARRILLERYFLVYGPATLADCAAFTGYGLPEIRRLLKKYDIPLQTVECEGITYAYLGSLQGDLKIPTCLFLTGFDQMIMGYKDRTRLYDRADQQQIITCSGIVYPTVLLHGRLQARWKWEKNQLLITPFHEISASDRELILAKGEELFADLGVRASFLAMP